MRISEVAFDLELCKQSSRKLDRSGLVLQSSDHDARGQSVCLRDSELDRRAAVDRSRLLGDIADQTDRVEPVSRSRLRPKTATAQVPAPVPGRRQSELRGTMFDLRTPDADWAERAPIKLGREVPISASPSEVFAVLSDHATWPR